MSSRLAVSLLFIFIPTIIAFAEVTGKQPTVEFIKDSIDKYYYTFNYNKLEKILNEVNNNKAIANDDFITPYYRGVINYCLGRIYYNYNKENAYKKFELSLNDFLSIKDKDNAEINALISAAYGKLSSLSVIKSLFYGVKAKDFIEKAYNLESDNTKVLIVAATHLMHTPSFYGGDKKRARELLNRIISNKVGDYNKRKLINWGTVAEAYAYLAQLEILENHISEARANMKKALELVPYYGFVKYDLEKQIKNLE